MALWGLLTTENRFEAEIEPCCRKQYLLFGYLKEFGESDVTPDESEKRVLNLVGSPEEQEMVFSRFGLMNKLFELLSTQQKYMEAYEVGVNSGLTANSIQLLNKNLLLKCLKPEQEAQLDMVCEFLQAEHIATNPWSSTTRGDRWIHEVLRGAVGRGSPQIDTFVKMWEGMNRALDISAQRRTQVDIREIGQNRTASYVNLLVCSWEVPIQYSLLTHA